MLTLKDNGLIPAIAQDATTGKVLMLGYMNIESIKRTLDEKEAWFYSRSQGALWHKGETSGNYLRIQSVQQDCDGDALLLQVVPAGPTCHTGNQSCFFTELEVVNSVEPKSIMGEQAAGSSSRDSSILEELFAVIQSRRQDDDIENSYTARLFQSGSQRIAQKVIEEAGEVALAGAAGNKEELSEEIGDLLYHALVLMAANDIKPEDVWAVLRKRRR